MENLVENVPSKKNNKSKIKLYFLVGVLVLLASFSSYVYFKYVSVTHRLSTIDTLESQNSTLTTQVDQYNAQKKMISTEVERCEDILTQEAGRFDDFSYCQKFLQFAESLK